jgi:hypothetical protein
VLCDEESCLFKLFLEVRFWDIVQKINCEKCQLFLACGNYSQNQSFMYLHAFMPCECMWVFNWLYEKAMPTLLGASVLKETHLSLTDGDRNE